MLLTITTTHAPATDLGLPAAQEPRVGAVAPRRPSARPHVSLPGGLGASAARRRCCSTSTRSALVRGPRGRRRAALDQYVNDRPYVASSFLSVAIARGLRHGDGRHAKERPELAATRDPARGAPARRCRAAVASRLVRALFEPLGYEVEVAAPPAGRALPEWGDEPLLRRDSRATVPAAPTCCRTSTCCCRCSTTEALLGRAGDEIEKLLRRGEGWLAAHPERELIVSPLPAAPAQPHARRAGAAGARRTDDAGRGRGRRRRGGAGREAAAPERAAAQRGARGARARPARDARARPRLRRGPAAALLLADRQFSEIVGIDVSSRALEIAAAPAAPRPAAATASASRSSCCTAR